MSQSQWMLLLNWVFHSFPKMYFGMKVTSQTWFNSLTRPIFLFFLSILSTKHIIPIISNIQTADNIFYQCTMIYKVIVWWISDITYSNTNLTTNINFLHQCSQFSSHSSSPHPYQTYLLTFVIVLCISCFLFCWLHGSNI